MILIKVLSHTYQPKASKIQQIISIITGLPVCTMQNYNNYIIFRILPFCMLKNRITLKKFHFFFFMNFTFLTLFAFCINDVCCFRLHLSFMFLISLVFFFLNLHSLRCLRSSKFIILFGKKCHNTSDSQFKSK